MIGSRCCHGGASQLVRRQEIRTLAGMDDRDRARRLEQVVAVLETAPEFVPSVVGVLSEIGLGHTERKYVYLDVVLTGTQSLFDKSKELVHGWVSHREAAESTEG